MFKDPWLDLGLDIIPRNDASSTKMITVTLPLPLIHEVDNIRLKYRQHYPELFAYRATFVEGAIEYFINSLKTKGLIDDEEYQE